MAERTYYRRYTVMTVAGLTGLTPSRSSRANPADPGGCRTLLHNAGQAATTLSGGEAQRVAGAELSKRDTGRTLYILDEPTTGLHFQDIEMLLTVLHRLADHGNTSKSLNTIWMSSEQQDWIVDLGPEGGNGGGRNSSDRHAQKVIAKTARAIPGNSSSHCWRAAPDNATGQR